MNGLITVLVACMGMLAWRLPGLLDHFVDHPAEPTISAQLYCADDRIIERFHFGNTGDRPYEVQRIWVRRAGDRATRIPLMLDGAVWGHPLVVQGHGSLSQLFEVGHCPDTVMHPMATVEIIFPDGRTKAFRVGSDATVVCR